MISNALLLWVILVSFCLSLTLGLHQHYLRGIVVISITYYVNNFILALVLLPSGALNSPLKSVEVSLCSGTVIVEIMT